VVRIHPTKQLSDAQYQKAASPTPFGSIVFDRMIEFPSTSSKFVIRREATSHSESRGQHIQQQGGAESQQGGAEPQQGRAEPQYYTLFTDVTEVTRRQNTVYARNHLVLARSPDLFNWTTCITLLEDDTGFDSLDSVRISNSTPNVHRFVGR
jgi:hypothetical protein